MIKVIVAGAAGRMGKMLCRMVTEHPQLELAGAFDAVGGPSVGRDSGRAGPWYAQRYYYR